MALYRLGCDVLRLSAEVPRIGLKRAFVGAVGHGKVCGMVYIIFELLYSAKGGI